MKTSGEAIKLAATPHQKRLELKKKIFKGKSRSGFRCAPATAIPIQAGHRRNKKLNQRIMLVDIIIIVSWGHSIEKCHEKGQNCGFEYDRKTPPRELKIRKCTRKRWFSYYQTNDLQVV
jgi:hypothetical protein